MYIILARFIDDDENNPIYMVCLPGIFGPIIIAEFTSMDEARRFIEYLEEQDIKEHHLLQSLDEFHKTLCTIAAQQAKVALEKWQAARDDAIKYTAENTPSWGPKP